MPSFTFTQSPAVFCHLMVMGLVVLGTRESYSACSMRTGVLSAFSRTYLALYS